MVLSKFWATIGLIFCADEERECTRRSAWLGLVGIDTLIIPECLTRKSLSGRWGCLHCSYQKPSI